MHHKINSNIGITLKASKVLAFCCFSSPVIASAHSINHALKSTGGTLIAKSSSENSMSETENAPINSGYTFSSRRTARGLIGVFLNDQSAIIAGAATTLPISEKVAFDGGVDYVKWGRQLFTATFTRLTAGAGYSVFSSAISVIRLGGRVGMGRITTTLDVPPLFGIGKGYTSTTKKSGLYAESRATFEKNFDGLTLGGEVQIPVYFSEKVSDSTSISAYASLGVVF